MPAKHQISLISLIYKLAAVDCGDPPEIANGTRTWADTTYQSTATYECDPGHALIGSDTVECQANEDWTSPPECICEYSIVLRGRTFNTHGGGGVGLF